MSVLILGLCVFFAVHLIPATPLRAALVSRLGANPYKGLFALLSALGFALLVYGKSQAPFVAVWQPPDWTRHLALTIMPFAMMLLAAAYLPTNVKRITRHPMLWAVVLWAGVHLLANGDLASIILFGSFAGYALFAMASANRRGAVLATSRQSPMRDMIVIVAGILAYLALLMLHRGIFGVSPIA